MSKHIGTVIAVGDNNRPFNELASPCFNLLNTIGMQDKVMPYSFMIGEILYIREEEGRGTLLRGQLPKYACLTLHEQAFDWGERGNGSTYGIEDGCDRRTCIRCFMIVNGEGYN